MLARFFAVALPSALALLSACELDRELTVPDREPTFSTVTPVGAVLADTALMIRVHGSNFTTGTRVRWNDEEIVPDVRTERELFFTVPPALYPVAGTYEIRMHHVGSPPPVLWRNFSVSDPAAPLAAAGAQSFGETPDVEGDR